MSSATPRQVGSGGRLRVAFMGSPDFAVPSLTLLLARPDVELVVVITQPDRPAGRGQQPKMPPVKHVAIEHGLNVLQPESLRAPPLSAVLGPLDLDLAIVVAYGRILPPDLLATPRLGCWNVHGSLLPHYRGAAPIQRAVLDGLRSTGVTLMQMEAGLDTGPILRARSIPIGDEDTAGTMFVRVAPLGAEVLGDGLDDLAAGTLRSIAQDAAAATAAPLLNKAEGEVDWRLPASRVRAHVMGMDPWPGAFTFAGGAALKLWSARPALVPAGTTPPPGTVLRIDGDRLVVACGERTAVSLGEGQLPGRRRLPLAAMIAGRAILIGAVLGRR